jgi:hypothetical protein
MQGSPLLSRVVTYLALGAAFVVLPVSLTGAQTTLDKRQPQLMTEYKWASLTDRQRDIYVKGFLETVSFILYSYSRQDDKQHAQISSDWTTCAERRPLSSWQTLDWTIRGQTEKTVAAQFYNIAPLVCKDSLGKGDKKWRAVWLLKPAEWKSLPLRDRAIYLMAYVETAFAATQRENDSAKLRKLDICIASAGIEGLIGSMEETKVEWQYPLPWSVSRALGATCKD